MGLDEGLSDDKPGLFDEPLDEEEKLIAEHRRAEEDELIAWRHVGFEPADVGGSGDNRSYDSKSENSDYIGRS